MNRKDLEVYRSSWTHDTVESKKIRFLTESKRMTQLLDRNHENTVKMPPGCPNTVKTLRDQLILKHGVVAFGRLRAVLGTGIIHVNDLSAALSNLDLVFSRLEFAKVET
jgi:hypothetical protein